MYYDHSESQGRLVAGDAQLLYILKTKEMNTDEVITSPQNPRIKAVAKLRTRRGRGRSDVILIDGHREIGRAMEAGVRIREVFSCAAADGGPILQRAERLGARIIRVNEAVFAKIGYGDRAEGLVATADRPRNGLGDLRLSPRPLIGVVEGIEKPGNLGAIFRSADGAGVEALLVVDGVTDLYGPNVIRSSLGTVFCVPAVEVSGAEAQAWLADREIAVIAASPGADKHYTDWDLSGPVALLFGSEAEGLTAIWDRGDLVRASVPMAGRADSLNVSTTAALFFYEARRQREADRA